MAGNDSKSPEQNPEHNGEQDDDLTKAVGADQDAPTEVLHDHEGNDREEGDAPTQVIANEPADTDDPDAATEVVGGNSAAASTAIIDNVDATEVGPTDKPQGSPLAEMRPGYVLKDRFRLEQKLGAGAMGAVFRAVDQRRVETKHHDPSVAIKLIAGDFSKDSRAFIALQRETDKSQTLAHPNIITVYDFDRDGDVFFMTMESLTGTTLNKVIDEGEANSKATRKQMLDYIEDAANATAYAHRRNIVHSDLKPENIFITEDGTLKVLDFGIARAFSEMEGGAANRDPGEIAGLTPTYASCEMFDGKDPHPADDVFALGLIAYEMLTGEHPFGRKRATQAREERLKPKKIRGLSGYQWKAINMALAYERADRWQNAEDFRRKFTGAGRVVRQLSAALLVAVIGFGGYMLFYEPVSGPDIAFEKLSPSVQQQFNTALAEGQQAREFGDLNGALFYFDKAYIAHPRNQRVMKEIDSLLDQILAGLDAPGVSDDQALEQVKELQKYESLAQNPQLMAKKKTLNNTP